MALDAHRLVARSLGRSWRQRPARMAAAVAAGIGGVLLTTAMLLISASVLDAVRGASISGIRDDVVAVEARAPGGMDETVVSRVETETGTDGSRAVVISTHALTGADGADGGDTDPVIVFGVDDALTPLTEPGLAEEIEATPLAADEAFLAGSWARDHGLAVGDRVRVTSPHGLQEWRVAGLLSGEVANSGAVVIAPLPTVADAFDRAGHTDVLLLDPGERPRAEVVAAAETAARGAADVKRPGDVLSGYGKSFQTALTILAMFAAIAVTTAAVVLFLTWRLALDDARATLARMRLLGVRTRHLMLGSAMVMVPLLLGTFVIGAALGVWVGSLLGSFTRQITDLTQQAVTPGLPWQWPVAGAFVAAVVMFVAAWLSGIRRFTRITAVEAVTGRDQVVLTPGGVRRPLIGGLAALVVGVALVVVGGEMITSASLVFLFVGAAALAVVLPVVIGGLLRRGEPGAVRLAVGRQLELGWRRNAALSITFTVAVITSVAMGGVASSIKDDVAGSVERWTRGDLYVQAAEVGQNLQNEKFPAGFDEELRAVPGVAYATSFNYTNVGYDDRKVQVWSWGETDSDRLTDLQVTDGDPDFVTGLGQDEIAVSANFSRVQDLGVGDTVELPLPDGHRDVRITAVLDDSASDGGMIVAGSALYAELTAGQGVYEYYVGVSEGADVAAVRAELEELLAARDYPRAAVLDQTEMRDAFAGITSRLVSSFEAFAWVMFVLAILVGGATLASGLVERQRSLALFRLSGAVPRMVSRQLVVESLLIAGAAWLVALPVGWLAIPGMLDAQAGTSGLLPPVTPPMPLVLLSLPLVVVCVLLALAVANPRRANPPLRTLLAQE